jgi:hypothetical protein
MIDRKVNQMHTHKTENRRGGVAEDTEYDYESGNAQDVASDGATEYPRTDEAGDGTEFSDGAEHGSATEYGHDSDYVRDTGHGAEDENAYEDPTATGRFTDRAAARDDEATDEDFAAHSPATAQSALGGDAQQSPHDGLRATSFSTEQAGAKMDPDLVLNRDALPDADEQPGTHATAAGLVQGTGTEWGLAQQNGTGLDASGQDAAALQDTDSTLAGQPGPVLAPETALDFRERWRGIQAEFIDDPRRAVQDADRLVTDVTQAFTTRLEQRQRSLTSGWQQDGRQETEQLRLTMRHYRALVDQVLHD